MIQIDCVDSTRGWKMLAPCWNALVKASSWPSFFLSWEWTFHWWEEYGTNFYLRILVAREGDRIVGIAPLMIEKNDLARRLMLIGQTSDTLAEYLDFIVPSGHEEETTTALCRYAVQEMGDAWDAVFFERVWQRSPNLAIFYQIFEQEKFCVAFTNRVAAPFLELPGTWEELTATKSKNFRDQLCNSRNRLSRLGPIRFLLAGKDIALEDAFAHLFRLNRLRWGEAGASFRSDRYLRFHRALAAELLPAGNLCLALLVCGDEVVAARYDFLFAQKAWCMQGGWHPQFRSCRPGTIIMAQVIRWAIEAGVREYDFLGGNDIYKQRWASGSRLMVDFEASPSANMRALSQ